DADRVVLTYHGLDGRRRRTVLAFDPAPTTLEADAALFRLTLAPGAVKPLFITASCDHEQSQPTPFLQGLRSARRELRGSRRNAATVETGNDIFNEVLCRSMSDLCMLITDTPQGPYPYAGIPWYSTTFGRDGLITALQMLWFQPSVARGVLRRLAAYQAKS